jgi:hypothetical protein
MEQKPFRYAESPAMVFDQNNCINGDFFRQKDRFHQWMTAMKAAISFDK